VAGHHPVVGLDVDLFTPLEMPRVLVAITFDSYRWDSTAQRLTDMGIHYRSGATITAGWERWTLYLDDSDDLSEIIASLERASNETDLVRDVSLGELDGSEQRQLSRVVNELTDRQREVLATPHRTGLLPTEGRDDHRGDSRRGRRRTDHGVGTPDARRGEGHGRVGQAPLAPAERPVGVAKRSRTVVLGATSRFRAELR